MKINKCASLLLFAGFFSTSFSTTKSKQNSFEPASKRDTIVVDKTEKKDFKLFHLVRYSNTPQNLMPYLHPTKIANERMLLNLDNFPDIESIKSFALNCKSNEPVTLDLETWPYYPAPKLTNTIDDFLNVITTFKSVNNTSPIGFYGVPPKQAYQWKKIDPVNNPRGYAGWKKISDSLGRTAEKVDIFLPSFYMYNPDTVGWREMVDTTLAAIKRYSISKPVYAYIWPQYHQGKDFYSLQFIDTAIWRYQLEVLYNRVNGCIIWTSNKDHDGKRISWDPNMPWWQVTKSFLVNKSLIAPFVLDSFRVARSDKKVTIKWSTSTDTTTHYFIVERSKDSINFKTVSAPISSLHSYYTENVYQYEDKHPFKNKTYYRIQIMDKKGKISYSGIQ